MQAAAHPPNLLYVVLEDFSAEASPVFDVSHASNNNAAAVNLSTDNNRTSSLRFTPTLQRLARDGVPPTPTLTLNPTLTLALA